MLRKDSRVAKWEWNFSSAAKLHLVSFLLTELCQRPEGRLGERAWKTVEEAFRGDEAYDVMGGTNDLSSTFRAGLAKLFAQMMVNRQKEIGTTRCHSQLQSPAESHCNQDLWNFASPHPATSIPAARPPPVSPQKPLSPPRGIHSSDSVDAFSPSSSNRASQLDLSSFAAGHQAMFGSSSMIFDHARDLSTWGFLTPNDSIDMVDEPLSFSENKVSKGASGDDFMGVEWDETWLKSIDL